MSLGSLDNLQSLSRRSKGGKEVLNLRWDQVVPKDSQVRKEFKGIEELADSIETHGQEQPIVVSPKGEDGKYRIQKGERRWRACKLRNLAIEAIVNKKDQSSLDETAGELIENIQRDNLAPLEIAEGLQQFIREGWKAAAVAKRIGKTRGYVSIHLSLLKLPESILRLYREDITRDTETLNNLRQLHELDTERAEDVCRQALLSGISRKSSRDLLKHAKAGQDDTPDSAGRLEAFTQPEVKSDNNEPDGANDGWQEGNSAHIFETNELVDKEPLAESSNDESSGATPNVNSIESPPKPQPAAGSTNPWRPARPQSIRIGISTTHKGQPRRGRILTDRIDSEPSYCWVELEKINGAKGEIVRLNVSDLQLLGIEGEVEPNDG